MSEQGEKPFLISWFLFESTRAAGGVSLFVVVFLRWYFSGPRQKADRDFINPWLK